MTQYELDLCSPNQVKKTVRLTIVVDFEYDSDEYDGVLPSDVALKEMSYETFFDDPYNWRDNTKLEVLETDLNSQA